MSPITVGKWRCGDSEESFQLFCKKCVLIERAIPDIQKAIRRGTAERNG